MSVCADRLLPSLQATIEEHYSTLFRQVENLDAPAVDFVWIHTFSEPEKDLRDRDTVVTSVAGIEILENKANLALVERGVNAPTLESHQVKGAQFKRWCRGRMSPEGSKVWIAKEANANGGEGLFSFAEADWEGVSVKLDPSAEYVVQSYIERPLLWEGKFKYHFRVYCALTADMRFYAYRHAFAHVANKPFQLGSLDDDEIHLTNVAANIHDAELFHRLLALVQQHHRYNPVHQLLQHKRQLSHCSSQIHLIAILSKCCFVLLEGLEGPLLTLFQHRWRAAFPSLSLSPTSLSPSPSFDRCLFGQPVVIAVRQISSCGPARGSCASLGRYEAAIQ